MAHATDIVGYSYDAAVHCVSCTKGRFPAIDDPDTLPSDTLDGEGNEVHPIFYGEDAFETCSCCGGDGKHAKKCSGGEYDCENCDGEGSASRCCGDCGEELVS